MQIVARRWGRSSFQQQTLDMGPGLRRDDDVDVARAIHSLSSWRKPGPIAPKASCRNAGATAHSNNPAHWLWVLAFARTTGAGSSPASRHPHHLQHRPSRGRIDVLAGMRKAVALIEADGAGVVLVDQQRDACGREAFGLSDQRAG